MEACCEGDNGWSGLQSPGGCYRAVGRAAALRWAHGRAADCVGFRAAAQARSHDLANLLSVTRRHTRFENLSRSSSPSEPGLKGTVERRRSLESTDRAAGKPRMLADPLAGSPASLVSPPPLAAAHHHARHQGAGAIEPPTTPRLLLPA